MRRTVVTMQRPPFFPELPDHSVMYDALCARDAAFLGVFIACVRTTGIFCLPTCRARKPKRENVDFVPAVADAIRDGFRACKVCRPGERLGEHPEWATELLDAIERDASHRIQDADLRSRGVDPARARRYFKKAFGVTFHGYQRARRVGSAVAVMRRGASVVEASVASGFESESGFRDAWRRLFGGSPGESRGAASCAEPGAASVSEVLVADRIVSPLGPLMAVASERGLALLEFLDRRMLETQLDTLARRFRIPVVPGRNAHLDAIDDELRRYFDGALDAFEVALDVPGTPFQTCVWDALRAVPCGQTTTYAALADQLERPGAARAVGRANGENRIAIVVPCHRVIGSDGALTGYGGGLWRKKRLLELESRRVPLHHGQP